MSFKKLIAATVAGLICLSSITACTDDEKAKADQAAKDLAYLRAQKEKEVAEKNANMKKMDENQAAARKYQKANSW